MYGANVEDEIGVCAVDAVRLARVRTYGDTETVNFRRPMLRRL